MHFIMTSGDFKNGLKEVLRRVKGIPCKHVWFEAAIDGGVVLRSSAKSVTCVGRVVKPGQAIADWGRVSLFQDGIKDGEDVEVKIEGEMLSFRQGSYALNLKQAVVDSENFLKKRTKSRVGSSAESQINF